MYILGQVTWATDCSRIVEKNLIKLPVPIPIKHTQVKLEANDDFIFLFQKPD